MQFKTRLNILKSLFTSQPANSIGAVIRNYGKRATFDPTNQVKGITYKAIDKIGMSLSMYEPLVKKPNGDAYVNHPLYKLFKQPNSDNNSVDFIYMYAMLFEIYGETFWYKAKGESTGKIKELYLLNPSQVELKMYNGELIGYILHKNNGKQIPLDVEEVLHDKRPNPFNPLRGMSVLERASTYVDTEIVTSTFTLNYIKNSASPSGIVGLPNMERGVFKQFTQQWRENYEGPENAGKTAFIRGGEASFKAVGATLKDIDQKVTRDMAKDDVLMMFDVPKGLLGMSGDKGLGRSDVEALEYIFAKHKINPMMNRLDRIYEQLARENKSLREGAIVITHENIIPGNDKFQLEIHSKAVNVWMTVNEVRDVRGLDPIRGGDELNPSNTIQPTPTAKKVVLKKKMKKNLQEEQEKFRLKLIEINSIYENRLKRAISRFTATQEYNVIKNINASSKAYEEWLFNVKEESEALALLLIPIIIELMEKQGEEVVHFITGELLVISPEARALVETNIKQIVGIYNADTLKALETTLAEGQTAGESLVKLKKRVESTYTDAKGYRAERIARTESLRTSNRTAQEVYKQNGFTTVQWFINPGACEFCQTFDGKTKTIGASFSNIGDVIDGKDGGQMAVGYDDLDVPPLHPNCKCSLVPVD